MATYQGTVTLENTEISVDLGLDADSIRLSVDGNEIGSWPPDECSIEALDDGVYTINAESESLRFVPTDPVGFANRLNGGRQVPGESPHPDGPQSTATERRDPPPPKAITMVMFYALSALTALLGLWALLSMIP